MSFSAYNGIHVMPTPSHNSAGSQISVVVITFEGWSKNRRVAWIVLQAVVAIGRPIAENTTSAHIAKGLIHMGEIRLSCKVGEPFENEKQTQLCLVVLIISV